MVAAPPGLIPAIEAFCNASTLSKRQDEFVSLVRWIRGEDPEKEVARVGILLDCLDSDQELAARFQTAFGAMLGQLRCLKLFAEVGIPSDHSLSSELVQHVVERLMPSARDEHDASRLLLNVYASAHTARWFSNLSTSHFRRLAALVAPAKEDWALQKRDLCDALRLLAARVSAIGLKPEVRDRGTAESVAESPFFQLAALTDELIRASESETVLAQSHWHGAVSRCRRELQEVHRHMESAGVSVELVFDLKKIERCLDRMERLVAVLCSTGDEHIAAVQELLQRLITGRLEDASISSLLRGNLNLIARKMVERTGRSGEHYIAQNRAEYRWMWLAAFGGGLLTVFTAAVKMKIHEMALPPFAEGFAAGTNYAVSFVLLQMLGLVLATKQPAATAATFAGIVRNNRGEERSSKIAQFVARISRTQLAAALGNVIAVSIGAVLFERIWSHFFAHSYLDQQEAQHVYEMLHPFASATAFYAIVTGIILWVAALAGGWCENFAVYYRLDEALQQHPAAGRLGRDRFRKLAHLFQQNIGGWSTSIVLGYLLGFTPVIGRFFGLPLDVRHVTLTTGQLALAAARFGVGSLGDRWFYHAVEGIAVIFFFNLTVSFSIACMVALRAYNVGWREQIGIARFLLVEALRSPRQFLWPVKEKESAVTQAAGSD